jgi:hypothetical protein
VSSIRNIELYKLFLKDNIIIFLYFCFTSLFILKIKRIGGFLFGGVVSITSVYTALNLFTQFSKINLIILFFYLLIAYYIYQFYLLECDEAYYKSNLDGDDLFKPMLKEIKCEIYKGDELMSSGYLTNWSEEACFVSLDPTANNKKFRKCELKIFFEGKEFTQIFDVVARLKSGKGIGLRKRLKAKEKNTAVLGWAEFYEIMIEMGFSAELLV